LSVFNWIAKNAASRIDEADCVLNTSEFWWSEEREVAGFWQERSNL